jgi:enediyne biosynthesis protein E4
LFESLDSAVTGVDFVNPINNKHPLRYLYASAMGCGGVAVGDVDGDGRPDLYFTGGARANALYRQTGDLKFEDITAAANVESKLAWSTGAALVDIDNDGDLDIYVCNFDSPNQLFVNDGKAVFTESARSFGLNFVGAGHTPAFCDYDLDGDLDLYLMTNFYYDPRGKREEPIVGMVEGKPEVLPQFKKYYEVVGVRPNGADGIVNVEHDTVGQPDRLVQNNGDGTFTDVSKPGQFRGKGNAMVWWDPNEDGLPDIYVANDFKDPDTYFENKGQGQFENVISGRVPHTTWYSMGADSADLNGDGHPDLMVADMSGSNHFKQKVGMGAMSANADFLNTAVPRQYMRNAVYINSGTGRLLEAAHLTGMANSDWTWTVRLSDFDNDGKVDVFLTNGMAVNLNVADSPAAVTALPGETEWDKHMRAGTAPLKEQNLAFRNKGELEFEDVSKAWGLDHVGMSYAATAADLDRDGDLELIVTNLEEPVSIYRNDSIEANRILVELRGTQSNRRGIGATVKVQTASGEQVRFLTLNRGYMASGEAVVHFGLGADARIQRLSVDWPCGGKQVFEDLAANQHFVITEARNAVLPKSAEDEVVPMFAKMKTTLAGVKHRETNFDDYARQPLLPHKHSQLGPGLAMGDIDGDGDDDLFFGGAKGDAGKLLRNMGAGEFALVASAALAQDSDREDMGAVFVDVDSDGDLDLYVVSGGVECDPGDASLRDRLYLNDGSGEFSASASDMVPDLRDSGSVVTASDFDTDGDLDLFVGGRVIPGSYPMSAQSRILRNDGGRFTDVSDEVAPGLRESGLVTSALWTDATGDGQQDLMVTYEWGPVRLFVNTDGQLVELVDRTEQAGLAELQGWWNGIAGSDIDHDGDIDYAVTNLGLNTKYHASPEKPLHLYYGDFDGSGVMQIIEAEYEDNTLYPIRGRSCSSTAMPFLLDKFDTFSGFAMASVQEIYTPTSLEAAHEFTAKELRSGILINDGAGGFEFRPLPRIAQIAPGFGVAFSDVDGDGNPDLYIAQNFFSPQAETGHMAGGVSQLLLGDGNGDFAAVDALRSGLVVSGDAKSLVQADLDGDGWKDFIVGVNDAALEVFQRTGSATGADPITIRLVGKVGNTSAVGSRVSVKAGEFTQTAEVYSGSGYLSQSSAALTFARVGNEQPQIEVRWPDGKTSVVDSAEGKNIEIAQPE